MCPPQRCSFHEPRRHRERAADESALSRGCVAHTVDDDVASTARDPRELREMIVHGKPLVPVELLRVDRGLDAQDQSTRALIESTTTRRSFRSSLLALVATHEGIGGVDAPAASLRMYCFEA